MTLKPQAKLFLALETHYSLASGPGETLHTNPPESITMRDLFKVSATLFCNKEKTPPEQPGGYKLYNIIKALDLSFWAAGGVIFLDRILRSPYFLVC